MSKPDRRSPEAEVYRQWYKTARWQKLRWAILVRDRFTCQMCGRTEAATSQLVCDHISDEGKEDPAVFWAGPFQTLCKPCHDGPKKSEEMTGRKHIVVGVDGWPVDERSSSDSR